MCGATYASGREVLHAGQTCGVLKSELAHSRQKMCELRVGCGCVHEARRERESAMSISVVVTSRRNCAMLGPLTMLLLQHLIRIVEAKSRLLDQCQFISVCVRAYAPWQKSIRSGQPIRISCNKHGQW